MSVKFKLVPNPTFTAKVPIHEPGKGDIDVEFTFIHLSEDARLALDDEREAHAEQLRRDFGIPDDVAAAAKAGKFDIKAHKKYLRALHADRVPRLMQVAKGWELADDFNAENVGTLLANYPSAFEAVMATYRDELDGARAKN